MFIGTVTDMLVSEPPLGATENGPSGPAKITCVPKLLGGEPKPRPKIVIRPPHGPCSGVADVTTGCGTTVFVGVALGPGVFVGMIVAVGVSVAPNGANALKPEVMHGCRPLA